METKAKIKLPGISSFFLIVIGVGIVIGFAFVFLPKKAMVFDLRAQILEVRKNIEEQKQLQEIYLGLQKKINSTNVANFSVSTKKKLSVDEVGMVPSIIRDMVTESSLTSVLIEPDINSLSRRPGYLLVKTIVQGENVGFRKFLVKMRGTPYVDYFERIQLKGSALGKKLSVHIWIKVG